ncbi:hypothetical protein ACUTAF_07955 [Pseudomonas sp. SP16.1]|uniref:hypothetical protein n=1 Tax=Pseudomonas sp. SP16.1 TaxID=3458854 RepID=UPI004046713F
MNEQVTHTLRAMAVNYLRDQHTFDTLDSIALNKAADQIDALHQQVEGLLADNERLTKDCSAEIFLTMTGEVTRLRAELEAARGLLRDMRHAARINPSCQYGVVNPCRCGYCVDLRVDAFLTATPAPEGRQQENRQRHPSESDLESSVLGYPLSKEQAVQLWHNGFRSEPITVLEAWEAIGHDIACNPSKDDLLDSLRNMAEICNAHGNDMPEQGERQEPIGRIGQSHGGTVRFPVWNTDGGREPPAGTMLYTTPQPATDVSALVEALEEVVKQYPNPDITHVDYRVHACRHAEQALATYRNHATVKRCPTCPGTCAEICAKARP